ncbi:DUF4041 domain-containing protein [Halomonas desiderata]|uniref:DUF4041 domain-containing protein n=1 Tax=Billgrantia desiderata TaxID=52021 RepID=UPI00174D69CE|nr:DUF4041 domain-containing protein [Halomonas desiderata]MCE8011674.1 DUF4041 domain-containing protein [Halomonas desiderata]NIC36805.1 DUF4041 domain-containing protein [Halomonas desiderata]
MSEGAIVLLVMLGLILSGWVLALLYRHKVKQKDTEIDHIRKSVEHLWQYEEIHNASEQARQLVSQAEEDARQTRRQAAEVELQSQRAAERLRQEAELERQRILSDGRAQGKDAREKAEAVIARADEQARQIIDDARRQAEETAGNALKAVEDAKLYERTAKAMRNIIEGYHDDYIVPNASLLDDLAEDFSHKDAGEKLKQARKHSRDMAKNGRAGDCDYKEAVRREYAIHFAVDAFNGKVDSTLSKVKHDNYGKLRQAILDAFAVVNHNGKPFKNARITDLYLQARLEELRWAVAAMELRRIEQEEQREIREQMREEEKARRDIEKALKQAEKEERMLAKAMEEARKQLENANDEERAQFQARLSELEQQLEEAESRGQRALSMAQQTKRGHVYIISNIGSFGENVFKIGMTRRLEPLDRVRELGDASVPFSFDVHAMIYSEDAPTLERELHRQFAEHQVNRINPRKEFFNVPLAEVREAIEEEGLEVHWTMAAEAWEYRESKALAERQLQAVS